MGGCRGGQPRGNGRSAPQDVDGPRPAAVVVPAAGRRPGDGDPGVVADRYIRGTVVGRRGCRGCLIGGGGTRGRRALSAAVVVSHGVGVARPVGAGDVGAVHCSVCLIATTATRWNSSTVPQNSVGPRPRVAVPPGTRIGGPGHQDPRVGAYREIGGRVVGQRRGDRREVVGRGGRGGGILSTGVVVSDRIVVACPVGPAGVGVGGRPVGKPKSNAGTVPVDAIPPGSIRRAVITPVRGLGRPGHRDPGVRAAAGIGRRDGGYDGSLFFVVHALGGRSVGGEETAGVAVYHGDGMGDIRRIEVVIHRGDVHIVRVGIQLDSIHPDLVFPVEQSAGVVPAGRVPGPRNRQLVSLTEKRVDRHGGGRQPGRGAPRDRIGGCDGPRVGGVSATAIVADIIGVCGSGHGRVVDISVGGGSCVTAGRQQGSIAVDFKAAGPVPRVVPSEGVFPGDPDSLGAGVQVSGRHGARLEAR